MWLFSSVYLYIYILIKKVILRAAYFSEECDSWVSNHYLLLEFNNVNYKYIFHFRFKLLIFSLQTIGLKVKWYSYCAVSQYFKWKCSFVLCIKTTRSYLKFYQQVATLKSQPVCETVSTACCTLMEQVNSSLHDSEIKVVKSQERGKKRL